ncbi:immunity protein Imm33 domain-containing protein [Micromonospora citrea]|uniref:immunity protein Imm33 domain-containing protein n=1 Tax=Micromonospora citrea TaxID=47855 RepID=UPI003CCBCA13
MTTRLHMMGNMISWRRRMPGFGVPAAQRDTCRRFTVEPVPPRQRTMVGLALSRPRHMEPLNALRHPTAGNGNGWFVWRGPAIPQEDDNFCTLARRAPGRTRPGAWAVSRPSPGWGVVLAPGYEDVWYDETLLNI